MTNPNIPPLRDEINCHDDVVPTGLDLLLGQFHGSNVEQLLEPFLKQVQEIEDAFCSLFHERIIDVATGASLGQYGNIVQEPRGDLNDRDYRKFISTKVLSIYSSGEIDRILRVAQILSGANFVKYDPTYPAGYQIEYETFDYLTVDGKRRFRNRIEEITPSGVEFTILETVEDAFAFAGPNLDFGFGVGRLAGQF